MTQELPTFSERVRFNWAFHDGTREAQQACVRDVTGHYDPLYAKAYQAGVESFGRLQARAETSDEAWAQHEANQLAASQATCRAHEIAKAIMAGTIKRLYLAGHNVKLGQAVCLEYTDAAPVRYYQCSPSRVRAIVERFNRRFGTL